MRFVIAVCHITLVVHGFPPPSIQEFTCGWWEFGPGVEWNLDIVLVFGGALIGGSPPCRGLAASGGGLGLEFWRPGPGNLEASASRIPMESL